MLAAAVEKNPLFDFIEILFSTNLNSHLSNRQLNYEENKTFLVIKWLMHSLF